MQDKDIMLQSWDTAGQERFRTITTSYYRAAMGAIICFDCTVEQSLKSITRWIKDFREKAKQGAPILLVATKYDLDENSDSDQTLTESERHRQTTLKLSRQSRKLLLPTSPSAEPEVVLVSDTEAVDAVPSSDLM